MYSVNEKNTIIVIDSLNFKDPLQISRFFVYDYNKLPFSGKMIINYGDYFIDTLEIINGYQNGFQKLVEIKTNQVISIGYYNQNDLIIYSVFKKNKEANYYCYATNGIDYYIKKKKQKITLKIKIKQKKTDKINFLTIEKLCGYLEDEKLDDNFIYFLKLWF